MIDYGRVYKCVYDIIILERDGLNNMRFKQQEWFTREITGMLCGHAHRIGIDTESVIDFLCSVSSHQCGYLWLDGRIHDVEDVIQPRVREHPLYEAIEHDLMNYKPGNVQVGPGEFFWCFYDSFSVFGISNQLGYDIKLNRRNMELKKLGSNFTTPELLESYQQDERTECLVAMLPVSDASKPIKRSRYVGVDLSKQHWSEVFGHTGKNGTLVTIDKLNEVA